MILVDGEKYACQQCIRGHRSSTCKHIQRPLVLVRSRGRPLTDSSQRIAIYAEEIQDENEKKEALKLENNSKNNILPAKFVSTSTKNEEVAKSQSSCCSGNANTSSTNELNAINSNVKTLKISTKEKSCCSAKEKKIEDPIKNSKSNCSCCSTSKCERISGPIYVLKAAKRQVFNVEKESLKLLDPVYEIPNSKVGLDLIRKVSKFKQMQSCRKKNMKAELQKYIQESSSQDPFNSQASFDFMPLESLKTLEDGSLMSQFRISKNKTKKIDSDIDLNQNWKYTQPLQEKTISNLSRITSNSTPEFERNDEQSLQPSHGLLYDLYIAKSCTVPGSCACEPDQCECPGCLEHDKYKNSGLTVKQQFDEFQFPSNFDSSASGIGQLSKASIKPFGKVEVQSAIPSFEQSFLNMLNAETPDHDSNDGSNFDNSEIDECFCEEDKCCCFRCAQHGIINGIRISDGACVSTGNGLPFGIQVSSSQFPLGNEYSTSDSSPLSAVSSSDTGIAPLNELGPTAYPVQNANNTTFTDRDFWLANHQLRTPQLSDLNSGGNQRYGAELGTAPLNLESPATE